MPTTEPKANRAARGKLIRWMVAQAQDLNDRLQGDPHADDIAQAAACAVPILAAAAPNTDQALPWLCVQLESWERKAIELATLLSTQYSVLGTQDLVPRTRTTAACQPIIAQTTAHLYDHFLQKYLATSRKRHGVYFTPPEIANYIVSQIDRLLKEQFNLPRGLASKSKIQNPKSKILLLDPACGTGVFLLAALNHIYQHFQGDWNPFVADLLPRLVGIEILPAAALISKLNLTLKLADTGYDFQSTDRLNIFTADALSPTLHSEFCILNSRIPVLLGNPPFSSLTTNTNPWIANLVRGNDDIRGYIRANGQVLGERKTWLHDDYVKFIRLAQWHVEQAGCGIVGFVTNHGYLDNATFRLMRHELLRVFPRIKIVDLHGNRKKYEVSPDGTNDENIFGLDQGVAIGLFSRPPAPTRRASKGIPLSIVERSDLWGPRAGKLGALENVQLPAAASSPSAPEWFFTAGPTSQIHPEYTAAWSLPDAMPIHTPAPVTARDHFVVAFTREQLEERIHAFRDLHIPDDEIRARYFQRTRSTRYQSGDTRGWKMSAARRLLAAEKNWQQHIHRCLYRPFDWRYVFWHPAMIDWPRAAVTRHLVSGLANSEFRIQHSEKSASGNHSAFCILNSALCLIARRQQLPTQPCTFFWIADGLALDGVIRSDNRGSESLFPLYLHDDNTKHGDKLGGRGSRRASNGYGSAGPSPSPQANFAPEFITTFSERTGFTWQPLGQGDLAGAYGPEDLLAYIYALFHAPTYRERYADSLRRDFPRIVQPRDAQQFVAMSRLGQRLIDLHLLRPRVSGAATETVFSTEYSVLRTPYDDAGSPTNPTSDLRSPPSNFRPSTFDLRPSSDFRVGGYDALRKWLQPNHRTEADPQYNQVAQVLQHTAEIMRQIDGIF